MKRKITFVFILLSCLFLLTSVYAFDMSVDYKSGITAPCTLSSDCATDEVCVNFICQRTSIAPGAKPVRECYVNTDCSSGSNCQRGVCVNPIQENTNTENYSPYLIIGIAIVVGFIILALILRRRK